MRRLELRVVEVIGVSQMDQRRSICRGYEAVARDAVLFPGNTDRGMDAHEKRERIEDFLAADRRARHAILKELTPNLDRDDVVLLAPTMRDPSPRTAARVAALLARFDLEELFDSLLEGLKPGKVELLRNHYRRIRKAVDSQGATEVQE